MKHVFVIVYANEYFEQSFARAFLTSGKEITNYGAKLSDQPFTLAVEPFVATIVTSGAGA